MVERVVVLDIFCHPRTESGEWQIAVHWTYRSDWSVVFLMLTFEVHMFDGGLALGLLGICESVRSNCAMRWCNART